MTCGHCGHFITGEAKLKNTKAGYRVYVYYRCTHYGTLSFCTKVGVAACSLVSSCLAAPIDLAGLAKNPWFFD